MCSHGCLPSLDVVRGLPSGGEQVLSQSRAPNPHPLGRLGLQPPVAPAQLPAADNFGSQQPAAPAQLPGALRLSPAIQALLAANRGNVGNLGIGHGVPNAAANEVHAANAEVPHVQVAGHPPPGAQQAAGAPGISAQRRADLAGIDAELARLHTEKAAAETAGDFARALTLRYT